MIMLSVYIMKELFSLDATNKEQEVTVSQLETKLTEKITQFERNVTEKIHGESHGAATPGPPVPQYGYSGTELFTFDRYSIFRGTGSMQESDPFYTHFNGYKLRLNLMYYGDPHNDISAFLVAMKGEYDHLLEWPVSIRVRLEILNQLSDHHHVVKVKTCRLRETVAPR